MKACMHTVTKYKDVLLDEFYLDSNGLVRRKKDGYYNRFKANDLASFFEHKSGYWHIQVPKARTVVKRSHLVLLLNGQALPPDKEVDHIDGDRSNDLPTNLRVVDRQLNSRNRKKRVDNTSGVTGIRWSAPHQHYVIRRTVGNVRKSTSRNTLAEALIALEEFKKMDSTYTDRHGQ